MSHAPNPLEHFKGRARLFPLPDLVLFPYAAQGLHIFEPRYRQLMDDALADDRLIGMALLRPGWEEDYHKRPPIHPMICLGRIYQEERLADGTWNLILCGLARARIAAETNADRLYREADVHVTPDAEMACAHTAGLLRRHLAEETCRWFADHTPALAQLKKLLQSDLTLGALCDVLGFHLPLAVEVKQQLLEDIDVEQRTRRLVSYLQTNAPPKAATSQRFPPEFSAN